jgi:quercetin dioxygenase-like cupin family protein
MVRDNDQETSSSCYVHEDDVGWGDYSAYYPEKMMRHMRAKKLLGPGGALPRQDMLLGVLELDPGASYPLHSHEAPEVYYVTQGIAECRFGEEQFVARAGTAIHTEPNVPHSFKNIGQDKFAAVGFWWAPGGKPEVLSCDLVLLDRD